MTQQDKDLIAAADALHAQVGRLLGSATHEELWAPLNAAYDNYEAARAQAESMAAPADRAEIEALKKRMAELQEKLDISTLALALSTPWEKARGKDAADKTAKAEQERDALKQRVTELTVYRDVCNNLIKADEGEFDRLEAELNAWRAKANHHRELGITLLDAKYLDPACHQGCKSLVHQHRAERLQAALEQARDALKIGKGQLETQRRIFGDQYFDEDFHGQIVDALAAIKTALAPDVAKQDGKTS